MPELDHTQWGPYQRCTRCGGWYPFEGVFFTRVRSGVTRGALTSVCRECAPSREDDLKAARDARHAAKAPEPHASDAVAALIGGAGAWR